MEHMKKWNSQSIIPTTESSSFEVDHNYKLQQIEVINEGCIYLWWAEGCAYLGMQSGGSDPCHPVGSW